MVAVPFGQEIIVNATTSGNQYRPVVAASPGGGFTIAYQDASGLGSSDLSDDVRFVRFDGFGNRLSGGGSDTLANTTTDGAQFDPSIAAGDNGKFVIAWSDLSETDPDFDNRAVRFQIFNADGTKSGEEIVANLTYTLSQDQPSVTVLKGGNIAITWTSEIKTDSSHTDIIRMVFDSSGSPVTAAEATVNTQKVGNQNHSTVHALSTGGFAVVWQDTEDSISTGFQTKTFVRFYNASGTPAAGNPIVANESSASDPQEVGFAELSDGRIVFTWTEPGTATPGDGSGSSIRARIYDPALGTFKAAFTANTTTSNDQEDAQIAALDNGQFVIVWTDRSTSGGDTSFTAVRMQVFNANGTKVGAEILVNGEHTFEQENPTVTVLEDFRFVVSWQDNSHTSPTTTDIEGFSIHSRIYDARIAGVTVDGDGNDNSYQGSNFGDTIHGNGGSDTLHGGGGIDFLFGGIGGDTLDGGTGNDKMDGGSGNDTYYVDNANDILVEAVGGGNDTVITSVSYALTAGAEIETFKTINAAAATAINMGGNDFVQLIQGNAGANLIDGKGGADTMQGFGGNDTYIVDNANDKVIEAAGQGTLDWVKASVSFILQAGVDVEKLTTTDVAGNAAINLTGNGIAQLIQGNAGVNFLDGKGGPDSLQGFGGADTLVGGAGDDTLDGGANPANQGDVMLGGAGNDTYKVDSGLDLVDEDIAFPGYGHGGTDTIVSTADFFWDVYSVGETDQVSAAVVDAGNDGVTFIGGIFDNTLTGHKGTDILFGRGGSDTYRAGDGVDYISLSTLGLTNQNAYVGVDGHNTVIVDPRASGPNSYDIVYEFDPLRDKIDVSHYTGAHDYTSAAQVLSHAVNDGAGNCYIVLGDGLDYLYLVGLQKADLLTSDFIV